MVSYETILAEIPAIATHIYKVTEKVHGTFTPPTLNSIRLTVTDDKVFELLLMLTPLEPLKRHEDVKVPCTKNTGTWILRLESFCEWRGHTPKENERVFCCYGIPGAGKTVIWY